MIFTRQVIAPVYPSACFSLGSLRSLWLTCSLQVPVPAPETPDRDVIEPAQPTQQQPAAGEDKPPATRGLGRCGPFSFAMEKAVSHSLHVCLLACGTRRPGRI